MSRNIKALFVLTAILCAASCGSPEEAASELMRVEAQQGTLYVVPEGDVTGGQVTYYIYPNGVITYVGDVSYNFVGDGDDLVNIELQPSFSGRYRAAAATVRSATYETLNATHTDFKVLFNVDAVDADQRVATVTALDARDDAYGAITVDLSKPMIRIKTAEVTGNTLIGRITLRLTDIKPN